MRFRSIPGPARLRRIAAEQGFTLVEVVVALVILGMAVVAMLEATSGTLRTQAAVERSREAVALAEWRMNHLAALPVESLTTFLVGRSGEVVLEERRYVWKAVVRPAGGGEHLLEAAVVLEWEGGSVALETVLFRGDLGLLEGREGARR